MNQKYKNLTQNTMLFAISSFGTKILSFLLIPLYTNILSTNEYGIADILSTTTTLLIIVFTINIADGIVVFGLDKKNNPKEILSCGLRIFFCGWMMLLCGLVVLNLMNRLNWPFYYFVFIFVYFGVSAFYQIMCNYLRAIDCVREVAMAGLISSATYIIANIVFLLIVRIGLYGYLIATIVGPAIGGVYTIVKSRISVKIFYYKCNEGTKRELIKYCFPLIFNGIALWINSCLDRYFVIGMCGTAQNGIYSVANKIPIILSMFYTVFSQAWTLSAIKEFDSQDKDGFFADTYEAYNTFMILVCSGLILFNIPIAKLIYARDFFVAWEYSSVLLLATLFNSLTAFVGSIYSAIKKSNILAITTGISAVVNTMLNVLLIPIFGVQGAAIATAVAMIAVWLIRIVFIKTIINIDINLQLHACCYVLICIQLLLEHTSNHGYIAQTAIVFLLLILNKRQLNKICKVLQKSILKNRR